MKRRTDIINQKLILFEKKYKRTLMCKVFVNHFQSSSLSNFGDERVKDSRILMKITEINSQDLYKFHRINFQ